MRSAPWPTGASALALVATSVPEHQAAALDGTIRRAAEGRLLDADHGRDWRIYLKLLDPASAKRPSTPVEHRPR